MPRWVSAPTGWKPS